VVKWNNNRVLEHDVLIIPSGLAQIGNIGPDGSSLVTVSKWRNLHARLALLGPGSNNPTGKARWISTRPPSPFKVHGLSRQVQRPAMYCRALHIPSSSSSQGVIR